MYKNIHTYALILTKTVKRTKLSAVYEMFYIGAKKPDVLIMPVVGHNGDNSDQEVDDI